MVTFKQMDSSDLHFVYLFIYFGLGATPCKTQGLFLTLCPGITPDNTYRNIGDLGHWTQGKVNNLPHVINTSAQEWHFFCFSSGLGATPTTRDLLWICAKRSLLVGLGIPTGIKSRLAYTGRHLICCTVAQSSPQKWYFETYKMLICFYCIF